VGEAARSAGAAGGRGRSEPASVEAGERKNLLVRVATAEWWGFPVISAERRNLSSGWHDRGRAVFWHSRLCLLAAPAGLDRIHRADHAGASLAERAGIVLLGCGLFLGLTLRPEMGLTWLFASVMACGLLLLPRATDLPAAWTRLASAGFGVFYVGGLLAALPLLACADGIGVGGACHRRHLRQRHGAYFTGRAFGRHKLAPAISPGKTVEGAVGGLVASLAVVFAARGLFMPSLTCAIA
jgi:CDP-diglyceride synthetase